MTRLAVALLSLSIAVSPSARGQGEVPAGVAQIDRTLDSPRSAMFTFLRAVNAVRDGDEAEIQTAIATLDLSMVGIDPSADEARRLTRHLWSALNRIRVVQESELPGPDDLEPGQTTFVYFPRPFDAQDEAILDQVDVGDRAIVLARSQDGRWRFSAATVGGIAELASLLTTLPRQVRVDEESLEVPAWVRLILPRTVREGQFLDLRYWQWLGLLVLIFVGLVIDYVTRAVVRPAASRFVRRYHAEAGEVALGKTVRALGLFAAALAWLVLIRALALAGGIGDIALTATRVFAVFAGTLSGWRVTDLVGEIFLHRSRATESKFDDVLVPLVRKTAKLFIVAFGVIYGAQNLNIDVVPLLTGLGIGGLAFAFAAKDTIENLFGSVAVVLDRPFEVGDWVVVGDVEGTVEELGFRSTRIRTFYNSMVTVPNSGLVRATVDNYGRRRFRRWKTYIGVQYDTPPEKLLAFAEGIRELVRRHPYTRKDYYQVWLNDFADSSLNILLYVFHEVPDWSTELRERERLFIDIMRLADRLGVEFAFPTRTVHLYSEEHGSPEPRHDVPHPKTDAQALRAGVLAAKEITSQQPWQKEKPGAVEFALDGTTRGDAEAGGDG